MGRTAPPLGAMELFREGDTKCATRHQRVDEKVQLRGPSGDFLWGAQSKLAPNLLPRGQLLGHTFE